MTKEGWDATWAPLDPLKGHGGRVALLGIRGYDLAMGVVNENDVGIYDDAIIRRIGCELTVWRASTDPGVFYIKSPLNPKGCASLRPGLWTYALGDHRGHPALVQEEAVAVDRLNRSGRSTGVDRGFFGLNIHSGGAQEDEVGRYSAGCQVLWCPEGSWGETWLRFYAPLAAAMREAKQARVAYLLVDRVMAVAV